MTPDQLKQGRILCRQIRVDIEEFCKQCNWAPPRLNAALFNLTDVQHLFDIADDGRDCGCSPHGCDCAEKISQAQEDQNG